MSLTMLSFGAGQDSTAILYKMIKDRSFRAKYAPHSDPKNPAARQELVVVFADTGDEHPHTYLHIEKIKGICAAHYIEFVHIRNDMGYHAENWMTLRGFYRAKNAVGSKAFPKTCTDNLKLKPIYRWLEHRLATRYGYPEGRKRAIKAYAAEHGRIKVLIGIARGEEKRMGKVDKQPKWQQVAIEVLYPLIDERMDRHDCQEYMRSTCWPVPYPSNCILCPFMSEQELLWLYRNSPKDYYDWVELEANKIAANEETCRSRGIDNLGVWGKKLLPEILEQAISKYGDWTDEQLNNYKFSHGCTGFSI